MLFKTWGYITMTQALSFTSGWSPCNIVYPLALTRHNDTRFQTRPLHESSSTTNVLGPDSGHRNCWHNTIRCPRMDVLQHPRHVFCDPEGQLPLSGHTSLWNCQYCMGRHWPRKAIFSGRDLLVSHKVIALGVFFVYNNEPNSALLFSFSWSALSCQLFLGWLPGDTRLLGPVTSTSLSSSRGQV